MSYRINIDPKSRKSARFISTVQNEIRKAYTYSGKKQIEIARILGVDKSDIHRRLKGSANLTARSIAEMAYALDMKIIFALEPLAPEEGVNIPYRPSEDDCPNTSVQQYSSPTIYATTVGI